MNKHIIIVIIASITIVGVVGYSALNIYAAHQLQFRAAEVGLFRSFELINGGKMSLCNPLPIPVSFNEVNIIMIFQGENKGTLKIQNIVLAPNSDKIVQGKFSTETLPDVQEAMYLTMHFDGMFRDEAPVRIDARKMEIVSEISTQLLGFPYTVTTHYPEFAFWEIMDSTDGRYSC